MKTPILFSLIAFIAAASAEAAITTSGNFQTGTPTLTLSITAPFSLTITTSGTARYFIFDNWVTTDGSQNSVTPPAGQNIFYTINGGSTLFQVAVSELGDNFNTTVNDVTPGDAFLSANFTVTAGQVLTFNPASFTFSSNSNFNPNIPAIFTGNVFLAGINGNRLSNSTAVPEPTTALFGLLSLTGLLLVRKKQ